MNAERLGILDALTRDPKTSCQCVPHLAHRIRKRGSCQGVMGRAENSSKLRGDFLDGMWSPEPPTDALRAPSGSFLEGVDFART